MGVVDVLVGRELSGFDVESHLLVGIAEGHAAGGEAVDLLDREHRVVHRVVEYMLVHLYLIDDVGRHLQAVLQLVEGRQEHLFYNLQVAEVAHGQVVLDERYLVGQALQLVRLGTDQFEDVGVLLVRHDRRARRTLLW